MLRLAVRRVGSGLKSAILPKTTNFAVQPARFSHDENQETDEEFDARYEAYFNRPDIDAWEIRKAMNDLAGKCIYY